MAVSEWVELCRQCLFNRSSAAEFVNAVQGRHDVDGRILAKALIDSRSSVCPPTDPLPSRYLESLLVSGTITTSDIILALVIRYNGATRGNQKIITAAVQADVTTLQDLTPFIVSSKILLEHKLIRECLLVTSRWLIALTKVARRDERRDMSSLTEAVGALLATLCATSSGIELLSEKEDSKTNEVAKTISAAVEAVLGLFPAISRPLANRLSEVQKHIAMFSQQDSADMQALQFQAGVAELQVVATRAGTTALLQSLITTGQTVDDNTIFSFLAGRHANDYSSMFLDVLFASFQILKQSQALPLQQIELYIRNRLPAILALISQSSFESFSAEQALTSAWAQLELTSTTMLCAQRFLHACSLNGLLSSGKAVQLIDNQELSASLTTQLYVKDDVVGQLNGSSDNAERLIGELLQAEANGVVISQALVEIMVAYARRKETHHLKDLAQVLLRRPDSINALALFHRPILWISPICTLLDEWQWDEIHSESQPLYDEFGSIFLLVITTKRRLDHTASALGIKGFVARYLDQEGVERTISELSPEAQKHFGDWIGALYVAESLSDELTTNCSPHEFYMLVPTLLRQSVLAYQAGKLNENTLKGGLEYLLEPFLLPSLVSAMTWANANPSAGAVVKPILTKATDNTIHGTILSMTQSPADFNFQNLGKVDLQVLQKNISAAVTGAGTNLSMRYAVLAYGGDAVIKCLLNILLSFSGSNQFILALDLAATLICLADLRSHVQLRLANIGQLLKKRDTLNAEAIVHLCRRTEAYSDLLVIQDVSMDIANLPDINETNGNMTQADNIEQPVDDIDQVLNESAAMNAMDTSLDAMDSGMDQVGDLDSFYLQDDNMGLGNLDDLDLDMF